MGWIANKFPSLVKLIHSQGHEIASHGYRHSLIYNQTPAEFQKDVQKTKHILEDITGVPIKGYRGASFSITKKSLWAIEILAEEGFLYDSSIFPVYHDRYGIPSAPSSPYEIRISEERKIVEIPPLCKNVFRKNFPLGGGGYLRLFPVGIIMREISKKNSEGKSAIIYFHPWELDPNQPFIDSGSRITNLRHRIGLKKMDIKLKKILSKHRFSTFSHLLDEINSGKIDILRIKINDI